MNRQEMIESMKKMKVVAVIVAILMIALGVFALVNPSHALNLVIWLLFIGLFLYGIMNIVVYCKTPEPLRNGSYLGLGILWVIIGGLLIVTHLVNPDEAMWLTSGTLMVFVSTLIAFACLFGGINALCSCGAAKENGGSTTGCVISGVLLLLLGIFMLGTPFAGAIAVWVFYGVFLIVSGISLLCRVLG